MLFDPNRDGEAAANAVTGSPYAEKNDALVSAIKGCLSGKALTTITNKKRDYTRNGRQIAALMIMVLVRTAFKNDGVMQTYLEDQLAKEILCEKMNQKRTIKGFREHVESVSATLIHFDKDIDDDRTIKQNILNAVINHHSNDRLRHFADRMDDDLIRSGWQHRTVTELLDEIETKEMGVNALVARLRGTTQTDVVEALQVESPLRAAAPLTPRDHPGQPQASSAEFNMPSAQVTPTESAQPIPRQTDFQATRSPNNQLVVPFRDQARNGRFSGDRRSTNGNGLGPRWRPREHNRSAPGRGSIFESRWQPPSDRRARQPTNDAPFDGTRHTKNWTQWNTTRRPGDGDVIHVEIWTIPRGSRIPVRPAHLTYKKVYWCPYREKYCFTSPEEYRRTIERNQRGTHEDRYVASVAEATANSSAQN